MVVTSWGKKLFWKPTRHKACENANVSIFGNVKRNLHLYSIKRIKCRSVLQVRLGWSDPRCSWMQPSDLWPVQGGFFLSSGSDMLELGRGLFWTLVTFMHLLITWKMELNAKNENKAQWDHILANYVILYISRSPPQPVAHDDDQ